LFVFLVDLRGTDGEAGEEENLNDLSCDLGHAAEEGLKEFGVFLDLVRHRNHFPKHLVHQVNIIVPTDSLDKVKVDTIALDEIRDEFDDLPDHREPLLACGNLQKTYPVRNQGLDDTVD
jgi:hypothetical protein